MFTIEIEPEVRDWLEALPAKHFLKVDEYVGLLAEQAESLSEPFARYLGDGVRELRPTLDGAAIRITYWLAPRRRPSFSQCSARPGCEKTPRSNVRNSPNRPARQNTNPPTRNSSAQSREENWTDEPCTLEESP
nr:type II toxin-antitoxin system RelE/ParE family toxin [Nocardia bovistercoris]